MSDDLDELERHVRSIWPDIGKPRPALDTEDRAVAAKLLGKDNFARLDRAQSGERVKYRPVRTLWVDYYFITERGFAWVIEGVETTGRRVVADKLSGAECYARIQRLEADGYRCRLIVTEPMRAKGIIAPQPAPIDLSGHHFAAPARARSARFDADRLRRITS